MVVQVYKPLIGTTWCHFPFPPSPWLYAPSAMVVTVPQKQAIEEVINVLVNTSPPRGKRHLSALFMDLVDRAEYPEYYEVCSPFL